jgi:hypothetical protein
VSVASAWICAESGFFVNTLWQRALVSRLTNARCRRCLAQMRYNASLRARNRQLGLIVRAHLPTTVRCLGV